MIKVSLEVRGGAVLSRVAVQAESITQALSIVEGHYPGSEVRVVFPIDSEEFFIEAQERIGAHESTAVPAWSTELTYRQHEGLDRNEAGLMEGKTLSGVSGGE